MNYIPCPATEAEQPALCEYRGHRLGGSNSGWPLATYGVQRPAAIDPGSGREVAAERTWRVCARHLTTVLGAAGWSDRPQDVYCSPLGYWKEVA